jgi:tetratricopeptide (TPR) repeat protein
MLETIRQYAWEKLGEAGEEPRLVEQHRDWYARLAERASGELSGPGQAAWLTRLEAEHDNLRAVLRRGLEDEGGAEVCLRLCHALHPFWVRHGYVAEGRRWIEAALSRGAGASARGRAKALYSLGHLAYLRGDEGSAKTFLEESAALQRAEGDKDGLSHTLAMLGAVLVDEDDYGRAQAVTEESLALARELGDRQRVAWVGVNLGNIALAQGELARAEGWYQESLTISREHGNTRRVGAALGRLGEVALQQGDLDRAERYLGESLEIARALDDEVLLAVLRDSLGDVAIRREQYDRAWVLHKEALVGFQGLENRVRSAYTLESMACTAAARGDAAGALRLAGAASRLRELLAVARTPDEREAFDACVNAARQTLGGEEAERAFAEGRAMTLEQAVVYALGLETDRERAER